MSTAQPMTGSRACLAGLWGKAGRARLPGQIRRNRGGVPPAAVGAALAGAGCRPERALPTVSDTAVLLVRAPDDRPGVLKVSATGDGVASLRRERAILDRLWSDEHLGSWRSLLPVPLGDGRAGGGAFLLTSRLPGNDGRRVVPAGGAAAAAFAAIAPLHRATRFAAVVDEVLLRQWVDNPAERMRGAVPDDGAIGGLVAELRSSLSGRVVSLGLAHGDFYPGNVLAGPDGRVTGIVDWGQAREPDLALLDLAFWLLTIPALRQGRELGAVVAARLAAGRYWTEEEAGLLAAAGGGQVPGRSLLLLAWLRHVSGNLAKSRRYARSPLWSRRNVLPVLRLMGRC